MATLCYLSVTVFSSNSSDCSDHNQSTITATSVALNDIIHPLGRRNNTLLHCKACKDTNPNPLHLLTYLPTN